MSSNSGAEKPTLKYSRSSPCFHNNSWYLVKIRPSTSAGDVSPVLLGRSMSEASSQSLKTLVQIAL